MCVKLGRDLICYEFINEVIAKGTSQLTVIHDVLTLSACFKHRASKSFYTVTVIICDWIC